jgi:hypothetical protein
MWQNILCHVMVYFATSFNFFHVENKYTKNIPWHGIKYFATSLLYSNEQAHLLVFRWIAFSSLQQNLMKGLFKTYAFMDAWSWQLLCYVYEWPNFPNFMARSCLRPKCLTNKYLATLNASQAPTLQTNLLENLTYVTPSLANQSGPFGFEITNMYKNPKN